MAATSIRVLGVMLYAIAWLCIVLPIRVVGAAIQYGSQRRQRRVTYAMPNRVAVVRPRQRPLNKRSLAGAAAAVFAICAVADLLTGDFVRGAIYAGLAVWLADLVWLREPRVSARERREAEAAALAARADAQNYAYLAGDLRGVYGDNFVGIRPW